MSSGAAAAKPSRRELVLAGLGTLARLFLGFWVVVGILELVPGDADGRFALPLLAAVLAVGAYIWFFRRQVRLVATARFPTLRAVEALVLVAGMFLAVFSMIYVMISLNDPSAFTEPMDAFTGYYFAMTVLATVGFGDITPVTTFARSVTMLQMALDLAFIAVVVRVFTASARRGLQARAGEHDAASGQTPDG